MGVLATTSQAWGARRPDIRERCRAAPPLSTRLPLLRRPPAPRPPARRVPPRRDTVPPADTVSRVGLLADLSATPLQDEGDDSVSVPVPRCAPRYLPGDWGYPLYELTFRNASERYRGSVESSPQPSPVDC